MFSDPPRAPCHCFPRPGKPVGTVAASVRPTYAFLFRATVAFFATAVTSVELIAPRCVPPFFVPVPAYLPQLLWSHCFSGVLYIFSN